MIGHVLLEKIINYHEAKATLKNKFDSYHNLRVSNKKSYFDEVNVIDFNKIQKIIYNFKPQVIINAIGITKQRIQEYNFRDIELINSIFPHKLADECNKANIRLIHLSTDCVFSGKKGFYDLTDKPDATDIYGKSKIQGEVNYKNSLTIRKSTIGFELANKKGLLEWLMSQEGDINGYVNAIYSGVTNLELSNIMMCIIENAQNLHGIYHVSSEPVDKYTLLTLLKEKLKLDSIHIKPYKDFICDRSLNGELFTKKTGYEIPNWNRMIDDLITYKNKTKN